MIKTVNQDLLTAPVDIILHSCNCFHTMGGGVAKALRNKYPEVYEADLGTHYADKDKLGSFSVAYTKAGVTVFNLYTQFDYGTDERKVNYEAFYKALEAFAEWVKVQNLSFRVGVPYGISCGLAGGDWRIIKAMLYSFFEDGRLANCELWVCKRD